MHNIFISYSTKNQSVADEIYEIAKKDFGLSCWLATASDGIQPGELYPDAIADAIENCQVVIFIDSSHSVKSKFVYRELEKAVSNEKIIIRFTIEKYSHKGLESEKRVIDFFTSVEQWIDASENYHKCITPLCNAITNLMGKDPSTKTRQQYLKKRITQYINARTLSDPSWIDAISSQYFLIEIAFLLNLTTRADYYELEEEFYAHSCKLARGGRIVPAPNQILVVPSENEKLIERMQKEEDDGEYYPSRLRASNIDTQEKKDLIFYNYYYGLMAGIIDRLCQTNDSVPFYRAIRVAVVEQLFKTETQDIYGGGLYHYRLPWITARALISLARYDNNEIRQTVRDIILPGNDYLESSDFFELKRSFAKSIIERMTPQGYWNSGAGNWVTKWESTGLCLEAIFANNFIGEYFNDIQKIFKYIFDPQNKNDWLKCYGFDSPNNSNMTLSNVILASVVFRIIKRGLVTCHQTDFVEILSFFEECFNTLILAENNAVQQQCTLPQCLYYILVAIMEERNGLE